MALTVAPYVVLLYGSAARGDCDEQSDRDLLLLCDDREATSNVLELAVPFASVSHYTWAEFAGMRSYGSLFLHHLDREARELATDQESAGAARYRALMATLPPYARANRDLISFGLALDDIEDALNAGDTSPAFELGAIATVMRHSSIVGCYLRGSLCFGRYESVRRFCEIAELPSDISSGFPALYEFRMYQARRAVRPTANGTEREARRWLHLARMFLREVQSCHESRCALVESAR